MGVYDSINGYVNCPYCSHRQYTKNQTKLLLCRMDVFEPGSILSGGPFLNEEYPLSHYIDCLKCNNPFALSFTIQNQVITGLYSYKTEAFERKRFFEDIDEDNLIKCIKKNCITTILVTYNLSAEYDFDDHYCDYNPDFSLLLFYVNNYLENYGNRDKDSFLSIIFNDLEEWVNIQYLQEVNIDFHNIYRIKDKELNPKEMVDGYDDIITLLKLNVKEKVGILREQLGDFYQYFE